MTLSPPFSISARLLPALTLAGATIQLENDGWTSDRRQRFRWTIDLPDGSEHTGNDLKSGVGGCSLQEAFGSLLSFLSAAGASWPDGENADLFPAAVCEWAAWHSDELSFLGCQIEETAGLIS